jgi:hypothetical protein
VQWSWRPPRKDFAPAGGHRSPRKPRQDAKGPNKGKGKGDNPRKGAPPRRAEPKGDGGQAFAGLADLLKKG